MKSSTRLRIFLPLALAASLLSAVVWADAPTLGVASIKPGMRGYGLSVFRGETPERFDVEVIDVLHNFRPDQDLILVKTDHAILRNAITVAGMSGSPVYLNDKLIGAYAYGWQFGKDPIVGVTPIANMMAEIARPLDPRIWRALGTLPTLAKNDAAPAKRANDARRAARFERTGAFGALRAHAAEQRTRDVDTRLVPAATPLMISGMTDTALRVLGDELAAFGIVPLEAGGGAKRSGSASERPARFVDGGSIGVQLIRGDINATAIGTVTHVAGDRLVAFGHPMLNAGQVGLPTCTSRVVHVLASQMRSFKLAEAVTPLGTLIHDRQAAIVVDQKLRADMIPVTLRLHGVEAARTEWRVELVNQKLLTPMLLFGATLNALSAAAANNTDTVFRVKNVVKVDGHGTITTEDFGYSSGGAADIGLLSRMRAFDVLGAVYGNPFEDGRVSSIEVDIDVRYERDVVTLVDASAPSEEVDPGKPVNVYVTLRRFDAAEEAKLVRVMIPASAAGESVELSFEAGDAVQLEEPKPETLDDILAAVSHGYPATSLIVSTKLPSQGVRLRGQLARSLPGSAFDTLQPVNGADRGTPFPTYERLEVPLGRVVTGSAKLKLNVRQEPLR